MKYIQRLGIRGRLLLSLTLGSFALIFFILFIISFILEKHLIVENQQKLGHLIAETTARDCTPLLMTQNILQLRTLLDHELTSHTGTLVYLFVLGPHDELLGHTFKDGFPTDLLNLHKPSSSTVSKIFNSPEGEIVDFQSPILDGRLGWVRVGLSGKEALQQISNIRKILGIIFLGVYLIVLIGIIIYTNKFATPLAHLESVVQTLDDFPIAFAIFDKNKQCLKTNLAWEQQFPAGPTDKEAPTLFPSSLGKPELWLKRIDIVLKGGSFKNEEESFLLPSGSTLWGSWILHPWFDWKDEVGGFFIIFENITKKKIAFNEKEEIQKKFIHSEKLASIGMLAAGIAHEINNPLAIVSGNLGLINEELRQPGTDSQAKIKLYMKKGFNAVERIKRIVNGMRTYARTDSEQFEPVDLHFAIQDTIDLVEDIFRQSGITLQSDLAATNPKLLGNFGKLQQIIMNFITNARDATEGCPERIVHLSTENLSHEMLVLHIKDSGTGISLENQKKLFQPFFTTKPMGKGTGLGLALSSTLIASMKGEVKLHSTSVHGTTFSIIFPRIQNLETMIPKICNNANQAILERKALRILVVDDEDDIREILALNLISFGHEVVEAKDGLEAYEILLTQSFDRVMTDINMPRKSGIQLIEDLDKMNLPNLVGTQFIILTGGVATDFNFNLVGSLKGRSIQYLAKPFSNDEIVNALYPKKDA